MSEPRSIDAVAGVALRPPQSTYRIEVPELGVVQLQRGPPHRCPTRLALGAGTEERVFDLSSRRRTSYGGTTHEHRALWRDLIVEVRLLSRPELLLSPAALVRAA